MKDKLIQKIKQEMIDYLQNDTNITKTQKKLCLLQPKKEPYNYWNWYVYEEMVEW